MVSVSRGSRFTRYSIEVGGELFEAWTFPDRPIRYGWDCAPVATEDFLRWCDAGGDAVLAAIWECEPELFFEPRRAVA